MFGADRFWSAFARAGMLSTATYKPVEGDAVTVKVGLTRPDVLMMGDMVQASQPVIEYPAMSLPHLKDGSEIDVDGKQYIVRGHPRAKGDGLFKVAELVAKK